MNNTFIANSAIDYNETEMREYITDALKASGCRLHRNMRLFNQESFK